MVKGVCEPLIIVFTHYAPGFTAQTLGAVRFLIDASQPAYAQYLPVSGYLASFNPDSKDRADVLVNHLHELRRRHEQYRGLGVALRVGRVIFEIDERGQIASAPMGDLVNFAIRDAVNDSEMTVRG